MSFTTTTLPLSEASGFIQEKAGLFHTSLADNKASGIVVMYDIYCYQDKSYTSNKEKHLEAVFGTSSSLNPAEALELLKDLELECKAAEQDKKTIDFKLAIVHFKNKTAETVDVVILKDPKELKEYMALLENKLSEQKTINQDGEDAKPTNRIRARM